MKLIPLNWKDLGRRVQVINWTEIRIKPGRDKYAERFVEVTVTISETRACLESCFGVPRVQSSRASAVQHRLGSPASPR